MSPWGRRTARVLNCFRSGRDAAGAVHRIRWSGGKQRGDKPGVVSGRGSSVWEQRSMHQPLSSMHFQVRKRRHEGSSPILVCMSRCMGADAWGGAKHAGCLQFAACVQRCLEFIGMSAMRYVAKCNIHGPPRLRPNRIRQHVCEQTTSLAPLGCSTKAQLANKFPVGSLLRASGKRMLDTVRNVWTKTRATVRMSHRRRPPMATSFAACGARRRLPGCVVGAAPSPRPLDPASARTLDPPIVRRGGAWG